MSIKLRDLIKKVRATKTAAEEREVIAREAAALRQAFKEQDGTYRQRNVAKLMYMHMLGYPSHFGQMETLKLIASSSFSDKRVGYLGLMVLLDERQEVLMLVTNSLKNDLHARNPHVVGLALCALGTLASAAMARDLLPEVEALARRAAPGTRAKALLCALRVVERLGPEAAETLAPLAADALSDRDHGVCLAGCALASACLLADASREGEARGAFGALRAAAGAGAGSGADDDEAPGATPARNAAALEALRPKLPALCRALRALAAGGAARAAAAAAAAGDFGGFGGLAAAAASDLEVGGVADPFLQVSVLRLLRLLGAGDPEAAELMSDALAAVAAGTDGSRAAGNAVLLEAARTALAVPSAGGLRALAINLLGRFLAHRDNNLRAVALDAMGLALSGAADARAAQRHRATVLACVRDPDPSIARRALALVLALATPANARALARELLAALPDAPAALRTDLARRTAELAERHAPDARWRLDTLVEALVGAGEAAPVQVADAAADALAAEPDLWSYGARAAWRALEHVGAVASVGRRGGGAGGGLAGAEGGRGGALAAPASAAPEPRSAEPEGILLDLEGLEGFEDVAPAGASDGGRSGDGAPGRAPPPTSLASTLPPPPPAAAAEAFSLDEDGAVVAGDAFGAAAGPAADLDAAGRAAPAPLAAFALWALGEYGDLLVSGAARLPDEPARDARPSAKELEAVLARLAEQQPPAVRAAAATALARGAARRPTAAGGARERALRELRAARADRDPEVQTRAVEYAALLEGPGGAAVLERLPARGAEEEDEEGAGGAGAAGDGDGARGAAAGPITGGDDLAALLGLEDGALPSLDAGAPGAAGAAGADPLAALGAPGGAAAGAAAAAADPFDLSALLGAAPAAAAPAAAPPPRASADALLELAGGVAAPGGGGGGGGGPAALPADLFGGLGAAAAGGAAPSAASSAAPSASPAAAPAASSAASPTAPASGSSQTSLTSFASSPCVRLHLSASRPSAPGEVASIRVRLENVSGSPLSAVSLQAAARRGMSVSLRPPSAAEASPGGSIAQVVQVRNPQAPEKKMVLKLRVLYTLNGEERVEQDQVSFPEGF